MKKLVKKDRKNNNAYLYAEKAWVMCCWQNLHINAKKRKEEIMKKLKKKNKADNIAMLYVEKAYVMCCW